MLQQTRVAAALPFYERFMKRFPTVAELAQAVEADVLGHWAGLGYYSRARNVHKASQFVCAAGGIFPDRHQALLDLPGVGDYTAAAIGSIAFDLPHAAVDGNLLRVLARLDNDPSDIGNTRTRARFTERAQELLDPLHPGDFNQAMMELGATVCVPKTPRCGECPVENFCEGRAAGRQTELPVKSGRQAKVEIDVVALVIRQGDCILLKQRSAGAGQMAGFWELPDAAAMPMARVGAPLGEVRHTITHHHYRYEVRAAALLGTTASAPYAWKRWNKLDELLLTTAAKKALRLAAQKRE